MFNSCYVKIPNMSVQLKAFAKGIDLSTIKTYLFGYDEIQSICNDINNDFMKKYCILIFFI